MYVTIAVRTARMVPRGMLLPGFARSPERLAPSMIPVAAGNTIAKTSLNEQVPSSPRSVSMGLAGHPYFPPV